MDKENYVEEGKAKITVSDSIFYNPHMKFNRDISSLAVGALAATLSNSSDIQKLRICDGMAASGIRGIRYAIENENIEHITFVDGDQAACETISKNIELNALKEKSISANIVNDDINHHLYRGGIKYNFIELDPFGSPVPFIRAALLNLRSSKHGFLSVTATDTAVLCGAHPRACIINYGSKPMQSPICHEVGLRILIGNVVKTAAPLHLGIRPVFSLSKRHYMKTIFRVEKSAKSAYDSMMQLGFVSMCQGCGDIKTFDRPNIDKKCEICGSNLDWAGDLWLGQIHDKEIIERMISLNAERSYGSKKEIDSILNLMKAECVMPPFYFDLHAIADKYNIPSPRFEDVFNALLSKGFAVSRTHFNVTAIKTNANIKDVLEAMGVDEIE